MDTLKLKPDLYWTGVLDPNLRTFDIIMRTEFGTTYNAYLLRGSQRTCLFETVKAGFAGEYFAALRTLCDPTQIDYLIVSHTEPDHAGSVEALLALNPGITIVGSTAAIGFLRQIVNRDFTSRIVKDGETLSLGNKTLQFHLLPNLHWPDTMFTYIQEDKALVTCDAFGSHYAHPGVLRSTIRRDADYLSATKYYFDNIIGPFKRPFMQKALDRVASMPLDLILTGHGPVLDSHIPQLLALYQAWCIAPKKEKKRVVIAYVSAYGYTRSLAEAIGRGVADGGAAEVQLYDMVDADPAKVLADMETADGILLGTPTMVGEALPPIWDLTSRMVACVYGGKRAGAFGSYGWSGEGVPHLLERMRQLRLKIADEGYRVRLKPTGADLTGAFDYGRAFGRSL